MYYNERSFFHEKYFETLACCVACGSSPDRVDLPKIKTALTNNYMTYAGKYTA